MRAHRPGTEWATGTRQMIAEESLNVKVTAGGRSISSTRRPFCANSRTIVGKLALARGNLTSLRVFRCLEKLAIRGSARGRRQGAPWRSSGGKATRSKHPQGRAPGAIPTTCHRETWRLEHRGVAHEAFGAESGLFPATPSGPGMELASQAGGERPLKAMRRWSNKTSLKGCE